MIGEVEDASARRRSPSPLVIVACLSGLWLLLAPRTADLAAFVYRSAVWSRRGPLLWDNAWFDGHYLPGYSLLSPPAGALLTPWGAGLIAALTSTLAFHRLVGAHFGERAAGPAANLFALAAVGDLFIGRLTYALGQALALLALLALQRRRVPAAVALAAACSLTSPVAALFLAVAAAAVWLGTWRREGLVLAATALAPALVMATAFPDGGTEPFAIGSAVLVIGSAAAVGLTAGLDQRVLRRGAALYALAAAVSYVLPTTVGSNVSRLGAGFALPLLACLLVHRRRLLVALAAPLLIWQLYGPVSETLKAASPTARASAYRPLLGELARLGAAGGRVEVVPTASRWESVYVARRFLLARGWETQLDRRYNGLFYAPRLDPTGYLAWLRDNAVRYVALADAPLEHWGRAEGRLLRAGVPGLREVRRVGIWRIYAVSGPAPLASGPVRLVRVGPADLRLVATRAGEVLVRLHDSPWWGVVAGRACLQRSQDGWLVVHPLAAGAVSLQVGLTLGGRRCPDPAVIAGAGVG